MAHHSVSECCGFNPYCDDYCEMFNISFVHARVCLNSALYRCQALLTKLWIRANHETRLIIGVNKCKG